MRDTSEKVDVLVEGELQPPEEVMEDRRLVLFDGVCKLCNFWGQFVIRHDRSAKLSLVSVQSDAGQRILRHFGLSTEVFDSLLFVEQGIAYQRSEAILRIVGQLDAPWILLSVFRVVPKGVRDWCYDHIAQNRYRWFGKYDQCRLPEADHARRFIR